MMFAEGHGLYPGHENLCEHVRFLNLDSGIFVRVRLPLFTDHCVLDSVEGLLVLQRDEDTAIRLLNPFTGDIVELPTLMSIAMQQQDDGREAAMLKEIMGVELKVDRTEETKLKVLRSISASVTVDDGGIVRVLVILTGTRMAAVVIM
jgi:hypothetical protein